MRSRILVAAFAVVGLFVVSLWVASNLAETPGRMGPKQLTEEDRKTLPAQLQSLIPLHKPLGTPQPGDWLDSHEEPGETYRQFLAAGPTRATAERRTIWIQPLGDFTIDQRKIVELSGEFLGHFFQLPVKMGDGVPLAAIPAEARRNNPETGKTQILSTYVLNQLLKPHLPKDAAVSIALTAEDLWPGEGWNFVFGQASLQDRVGVWSIHRFGNASQNEQAFQLTLLRTLKTAAHETGHMFSLSHCVHFECVMNGSNHLAETDRQPLWACPQCLAKLCYATGADPKTRFESVTKYAQKHRLALEQDLWERSLRTMVDPIANER